MHCPNLSLLDLSNISTVAVSHGILHIEKLQEGCPHLKVLRITNSHITLSAATLQEQVNQIAPAIFRTNKLNKNFVHRWIRQVFRSWRNYRLHRCKTNHV